MGTVQEVSYLAGSPGGGGRQSKMEAAGIVRSSQPELWPALQRWGWGKYQSVGSLQTDTAACCLGKRAQKRHRMEQLGRQAVTKQHHR